MSDHIHVFTFAGHNRNITMGNGWGAVEEKIDKMKSMVAKTNEYNEKLERNLLDITGTKDENARLRVHIEEKNKVIEEQRGYINKFEREIEQYRNEISEYRVTDIKQKQTIAEKARDIDQHRSTIQQQHGTINEQKSTIEEKTRNIQEQRHVIAKQEGTIEEQRGTIGAERGKTDELIDIIKSEQGKTDELVDVIKSEQGKTGSLVDVISRQQDHFSTMFDAVRMLAIGGNDGNIQVNRPAILSRGAASAVPIITGYTEPASAAFMDERIVYSMTHKKRGKALLINNRHFTDDTKNRDVVDWQASALEQMFKKLEFDVDCRINLCSSELIAVIEEASKMDHQHHDCFACIILSHGVDGEVLGVDCKTVPIKTLVAPFLEDKCNSLSGKPKLFFFPASGGKKMDPGIDLENSEPIAECNGCGEYSVTHRIPNEAHFVMTYATLTQRYIHYLCTVFNMFGSTLELMQLLTLVNHQVVNEFGKASTEESPCIVSSLTKQIFFHAKKCK